MQQAVFNFTEETMGKWGFAPFQEAGLQDVEVISCAGSRGVVRMHVEDQPDERRLDENDTIQWWEQVSDDGSGYVYLVEAAGADGNRPDGTSGPMPRTEEIEILNHGFSLELAGSRERISRMVTDFQSSGIEVGLQRIHDYRVPAKPLDSLTDRQREVLEVAYEVGYYDVPRRTTTKEVAAELGLDDSTVSEHLQRAEHNLLSAVLGD